MTRLYYHAQSHASPRNAHGASPSLLPSSMACALSAPSSARLITAPPPRLSSPPSGGKGAAHPSPQRNGGNLTLLCSSLRRCSVRNINSSRLGWRILAAIVISRENSCWLYSEIIMSQPLGVHGIWQPSLLPSLLCPAPPQSAPPPLSSPPSGAAPPSPQRYS